MAMPAPSPDARALTLDRLAASKQSTTMEDGTFLKNRDGFLIFRKDEAYELGTQWAKLYEHNSSSHKLIDEMMETYSLVNVVHKDFHNSDAIFQPFWKADTEWEAQKTGARGFHG